MKPMGKTFETDLELLKQQVIVETFRSSGPGGQRKNKVETAIRLKHIPTGMTVIATEHRFQSQNKILAFERLRERLIRLNQPKKRRIPTTVSLKAIEKKREKKKILSKKKLLRKNLPKNLKEWE